MEQRDAPRKAATYVLAYALWTVSVAASAAVGYLVQHALAQAISVAALGAASDPRAAFYANLQIRAGDAWSCMLIGGLVVVVLVFLEHWYRTGVASGCLLSRFLLVATVQLGILSLAHGAYFLMALLARAMSWGSVYVPLLELAATAICAFLYHRQGGSRRAAEVERAR